MTSEEREFLLDQELDEHLLPKLTIDQVRMRADTEYRALCDHLDLAPVGLEVLLTIDPDRLGAGYGPTSPPRQIELVYSLDDLCVVSSAEVTFPPSNWRSDEVWTWPQWRTDLWHETMHQIEHVVFGHLNPALNSRQTHDWPEWRNAVGHAAESFDIDEDTLQRLVG